MKKLIKLVSLTLIFFALSNCEVNVRESNATPNNLHGVRTVTDDLGCTWFVVKSGSTSGGVFAEHHPTCQNRNHRVGIQL